MPTSKIAFIATLSTCMVGVVNIFCAVIIYNLVIPKTSDAQTLITTNSTNEVVPSLPSPVQNAPSTDSSTTSKSTTAVTSSGTTVEFRSQQTKLVAGQLPVPTGVTTDASGTQAFKWCAGNNPDLPDEVCQAVVSIAANPVESNPHLGPKARQSLSLLPKNTALTMDESSWKSTSSTSGTMIMLADTKDYGQVKIKAFFEKQNNVWVLVDGQLI